MNKPRVKSNKTEMFATTVTPRFNNLIRRHAFTQKNTLGEILEKYQEAYAEKLEQEKKEKKAQKEASKTT